MIIKKRFLISVAKKHTQDEVFSFEVETTVSEEELEYIDTLAVRMGISMRYMYSEVIPAKYRGSDYWVDSICID